LCPILPVSLGCPFFVLFVFVLCLERMDNPETQAILGTRHRTKTNKTKNGQPRDTGNIKHKTEEENK
jgi:hypothetical protein